MEKELSLKEKYLLLVYHPEKGRPLGSSAYHSYGTGGAVLLELAQQKKIRNDDKKVILDDRKKTGDPALDLVIEKLAAAKRNKKAGTWINGLSQYGIQKKIRNAILDGMVDKRILRKREATALFFFKYNKYPARDTRLRDSLIRDIRNVVLKRQIGPRELYLLIGLIGATRLSGQFFEKGDRKKARRRIREIMKSSDIAKALDGTVAAVQTAIIGSIAASAAVTAAATSH